MKGYLGRHDVNVADLLELYLNRDNIFKNVNTLDPGEVIEVWDLLAKDTVSQEINDLPLILHAALLSRLESLDLNE